MAKTPPKAPAGDVTAVSFPAQRGRPAEVIDVAEIKAVAGPEPPAHAGEVDRCAGCRGVDELGRGKGEVRKVSERSPCSADA